jgi:putative salt-induced outer membrane protein YdiY
MLERRVPEVTSRAESLLPLVALALLLAAGPAAAAKTDVVVLDNGNEITGEVKNLQQGKLKLSTDHAGTLYVEWDHVHSLVSSGNFEVEDEAGRFYYGSLGASTEPRRLAVVAAGGPVVVEMTTVVSIQPIRKTFWQRVDGSLDLGLSYTSADSSLQYSLNANATYRQPRYGAKVTLSSIQTRREGTEDIRRDSLEFDYTRDHTRRYFGTGTLAFSSNTELGIDLRTEVGYAFGRNVITTNRSQLSGRLGLSVSRDNPRGEGASTTSAWGVLGVNYHFFLYAFPKTDILVDASVQPGITEWPRTRADLNVSLRREVVKDFTANLSVQGTYDSEPPEDAPSGDDLAVVLSLGWTF